MKLISILVGLIFLFVIIGSVNSTPPIVPKIGMDRINFSQSLTQDWDAGGYNLTNSTELDDAYDDIGVLQNTFSHLTVVRGNVKGTNITVSRITTSDLINGILYHNTTSNVISDVTTEFTVVDAGKINNTDGSTNTSGGYLIVAWTGYSAPG
jgi:hypothetical protein